MLQGEKWAKGSGISKLELTVIKENANAQKLYKKLGFEIRRYSKKRIGYK